MTGSTLRTVISAVGLVALGFWLAPRQQVLPPAPAVAAVAPTSLSARADIDVRALRDEIRAAVGDELRTHSPTLADVAAAPAPLTPPAAEPDDAQRGAADQAREFVGQVVTRGQLTLDDAMTLRPMLAAMAPEDAMEVRLSVAQAINAQRLTLDSAHALP